MRLTYENVVRSLLLLLLIIGSLTDKTVSPSLTILSFIAFEYMVRKLEKPISNKDHSTELKEIQDKFNELDVKFKEIKADLSIGNISAAMQRRK